MTTPPEISLSPPWSRQPNETTRWYARFLAYRLLGPNRSLYAAYQLEKQQPHRGVPGAWRKNAQAWFWQARAEAWDAQQATLATDAVEAAYRKIRLAAPLAVDTLVNLITPPPEGAPPPDPQHVRLAANALLNKLLLLPGSAQVADDETERPIVLVEVMG